MDKRVAREKIESKYNPCQLEILEDGWMKNAYKATFDNHTEIFYHYKDIDCERFLSPSERMKAEKLAFEKINRETQAAAPKIKEETDLFLRCSYIKGKNWENTAKDDIIGKTGRNLARIHQASFNGYGSIKNREHDSWKLFLKNFLNSMEKRSETRLAKKATKKLQDKILEQNFAEKPVLCHGDYHPWNLIYREDSLFTLDCEFSFVGTKSYDITRSLINLEEKKFRQKFLSGYRKEASENKIENKDFYMLFHATRRLIDGENYSQDYLISHGRKEIELFL